MGFVGSVLAVVVAVASLSGCGQPVCIVGIGQCDHYKKMPVDKGTGTGRTVYTLTASSTAVTLAGGAVTLKLTSTSTVPSSGSCLWELPNIAGSVGGNLLPDPTPVVAGALCTAGFQPTAVGNVTVKVTEKNSSFVSQVQITVSN